MSNDRELRFNLDCNVGRTALQNIGAAEAKYASQPQFLLIRDMTNAKWMIQHCQGATNPTFLNAAPLPERAEQLKRGDVVSVGANKLKLEVSFEN